MFGIDPYYYLLSWIGAFVLYYKLKSDGKLVIEFLPHIKKAWAEPPLAKFLDAILFTTLGAIIGTILIRPINPQQAIIAGIGWTGALAAIAKS